MTRIRGRGSVAAAAIVGCQFAYKSITRCIALVHTAQKPTSFLENMMQSACGR